VEVKYKGSNDKEWKRENDEKFKILMQKLLGYCEYLKIFFDGIINHITVDPKILTNLKCLGTLRAFLPSLHNQYCI
jgi:hypothetical protein